MPDTDRAARYAAAWRSARQRVIQEREFADQIRELIETALSDYQVTVAVTAEPYPGRDDA